MDSSSSCCCSPTYTQRLVAVTLGLLAVMSPLYIDHQPHLLVPMEEEASEGDGISAAWLLPLLLILLLVSINFSNFLDRRYTRLDPYWIHRVGGSSCGIVAVLAVLAAVLKCKSSLRS